jgi:glucan 1,3-beta-glucosidase
MRSHVRRVQIGNSNASKVEAPLWSYKLGLDNGWVPLDPRASIGKCAALVSGVASAPAKTYQFAASQTGSPMPSPAPAGLAQQHPWPPTTLMNLPDGFQYPAFAPMYTPTGTVPVLPMSAVATGVSEGDGWTNDADKEGAYVPIQGCSYPNPWDLSGAVVPTAACMGTPPIKR